VLFRSIPIQLAWPFATHPAISQMFGANWQVYQAYGYPGHEGTDFAVMTGTPVLAAFDGVVTEAASMVGSYGMHVRLRHNQNDRTFQTLYGHFSRLDVKVGDVVKTGQQIGLSGNSGNSTGPHMHFGLSVDGVKTDYPGNELDPMLYVVDSITVPPVDPPVDPPVTPPTECTQLKVISFGLRLRTSPEVRSDNILGELNSTSPALTLPQPNEEVAVNGLVFEKVEAWIAKSNGAIQYVKLS
jgi:murein DD-endopeptidase MepM/ murein hydrolase activator NlpD